MRTVLRITLFITMVGLLMPGCAQPYQVQHPVMTQAPFTVITTSDPDSLYARHKDEFAKGPEALAATYQEGGRFNAANRSYYALLTDAVRICEANGNKQCRDSAEAMLRAAVKPYYDMSERELRAQNDTEGAFNDANLYMKEFAYDFALLYHLTGDKHAATQAAIILDRYNEVIREWPLRERAYQREEKGDPRYSQHDETFKARWDASGLYGNWIPQFVEQALPLLYAYDLIYDSGVMQDMGVRDNAEAMLRYHIEWFETFDKEYGNLSHYALRAYPQFAMIIPEPEYAHLAVQWFDRLLHYGFYASGFWHEGSCSYHKDITGGLTAQVPDAFRGYSDPPGFISKIDGTRFDNLDLTKMYSRQFARMWEVLGKLTLPDRNCTVVHDTAFGQQAWWMPPMTHSSPKLLGCMGHVVMGSGEDTGQQQTHLHFSGMHGHEHHDTLNLIAWSQGQEMLSSTRYREIPGDVSTREWHTITAGHNTVVIDETTQHTRFSGPRRTLTEDDALPFPDPRYRSSGHGDGMMDGKLRFFASQYAPVQISEADGERAYDGLANLYRRTVAMVEIDESHSYIVDVFRVGGGQRHDWMLHGCLQYPYSFQTDLDLEPVEGTFHKYITDVAAAALPEVANFRFVYENGKQSRHWLMMPEGSILHAGKGPAMRREGYNPFTFVRHDGGSSVFVAVHEFWSAGEEPLLQSVEPAQMLTADPMDAAVVVHLADGRTDAFISRFADEYDGPETLLVAGVSPVSFIGRAAQVRFATDGAVERAYGVGVQDLTVNDVAITDNLPEHSGVITSTERIETGAAIDALYTADELPTDGSLNGAPVILNYSDILVQSFLINEVVAPEGGAGDFRMIMQGDPGITIEDDGDLTKMHYFPGWGIRGECGFKVFDTVLAARDDNGDIVVTHQPKSEWPEPIERGITYWRRDAQ